VNGITANAAIIVIILIAAAGINTDMLMVTAVRAGYHFIYYPHGATPLLRMRGMTLVAKP